MQLKTVYSIVALNLLYIHVHKLLNKKLTQVYSHNSCKKPLMEPVFFLIRAKDLFRCGTEEIMTGCSS